MVQPGGRLKTPVTSDPVSTPTSGWAIKMPGGSLIPRAFKTRVQTLEWYAGNSLERGYDKVEWQQYRALGYRCVRVMITELK